MARRKANVIGATAQYEDEWVYLYARISKDDKKKKREGVDSQLRRLHEECDRRGIPKNRRIEFVDNDISASRFGTKEREEYERLITRIQQSQNCLVMTVEQSRLVREELEGVLLKNLMLRHEMRLALIDSGDQDLTSASGDMMWTMKLFFSREESEAISRRTRRKFEDRRAQGVVYGRARILFGYKDNKCSEIDEEKKAALHEMRRIIMAGDGWRTGTLTECARYLESKGFVSPYSGKPYPWISIRSMLANATYAGWICYQGEPVRRSEDIAPIFTQAEFDSLQEKLAANRAEFVRKRGGPAKRGRQHLLTGFLRCGACGGSVRVNSRGKGQQRRWACRGKNCVAIYYGVPEQVVDAFIRLRIQDARVAAVKTAQASPEVKRLEAEVRELEGRVKSLQQAMADPASRQRPDDIMAMLAATRDQITVRESQLSGLARDAVEALPMDALSVWGDEGPETLDARRAIVEHFVQFAVIVPVGRGDQTKRDPRDRVQVYPAARRPVAAEASGREPKGILAS